ncbi:cytochrome c class I [Methylocella silvestris BL2]|uniref:Cytochrome c class I n=1 Tax=Methylocella silvestris (strain DSM 15510 / CIP 108128 / LMG 27833 / NCIMB 13906 / BL2) TaxID=395965 RepID=B8ES71_METSB|nr:c-type cytochrome [Methylocella silvestris]ACK52286.1 cytochrome c class I [Methylocella silvestris BL2]
MRAARSSLGACALALLCSACDLTHPERASEARQGATLISALGCGSCHTIPGIDGASANVGPSLEGIGSRIYVAGVLRNTPENLQRWIQHPQEVVPNNAMPDLPIDDASARKIVAYLETLR